MAKCNFCGETMPAGTGKLFVFTSGKTAHFCSMKCEKNQLKLKRKAIHTRWSEHYIKETQPVAKKKQVKEEKKQEVKEEVKEEKK